MPPVSFKLTAKDRLVFEQMTPEEKQRFAQLTRNQRDNFFKNFSEKGITAEKLKAARVKLAENDNAEKILDLQKRYLSSPVIRFPGIQNEAHIEQFGEAVPETKSPFAPTGRQDLAIHRFTQYSDKKGILLMHGVGSGKTVTSITMALNCFDWSQDISRPARQIVVIAPSGIFGNFVDELRRQIPGVTNVTQPSGASACGDPKQPDAEALFHGKRFQLKSYKYSDLTPDLQIRSYGEILKKFKDSVVILDEAHRLLRPIPDSTDTMLDRCIEYRLMSSCKRFIAMTGTPYNTELADTIKMLNFVRCSGVIDRPITSGSPRVVGEGQEIPANLRAQVNSGKPRAGSNASNVGSVASNNTGSVGSDPSSPKGLSLANIKRFTEADIKRIPVEDIQGFNREQLLAISADKEKWFTNEQYRAFYKRAMELSTDEEMKGIPIQNIQSYGKVLLNAVRPRLTSLSRNQQNAFTKRNIELAIQSKGLIGGADESNMESYNIVKELADTEEGNCLETSPFKLANFQNTLFNVDPALNDIVVNLVCFCCYGINLLTIPADIGVWTYDNLREVFLNIKAWVKDFHEGKTRSWFMDNFEASLSNVSEFMRNPTEASLADARKQQIHESIHENLTHMLMGGADEYSILGVPRTATQKDIETAYRRAALHVHPDKCNTNECRTQFNSLTRARNVLLGRNKQNEVVNTKQIEDIANIKVASYVGVIDALPTKGEQTAYVSYYKQVLTSKAFLEYVDKNEEGIKVLFDSLNLGVPETAVRLLRTTAEHFKETSSSMNTDLVVKKATRCLKISVEAGVDGSLFLAKFVPPETKLLANLSPQVRLANQHGGVPNVVSNSIKSSMKETSVFEKVFNLLFNRSTGVGTRLRTYLYTIYNMYSPLNTAKLAREALPYISIIDKDQLPTDPQFDGVLSDRPSVNGGGTSQKNQPIPSLNKTELESIQGTIKTRQVIDYRYPAKVVQFIYTHYTPQQQTALAEMLAADPNSDIKWWHKLTKNITSSRNGLLRCAGNFSEDCNTYTSMYNYDDWYPKYEIVDASNPSIKIKDRSIEELRTISFDCQKFRRILMHLILMKTGYMMNTKKKGSYLVEQAHLTVPNENKTKFGNPYPFGTDDYDLENFPSFVKKRSLEDTNPRERPTHYYLPLVYSCSEDMGLNIFASYLDQLGLKYIVLHKEASKKVLEREKLRAINKVYTMFDDADREKVLNLFKGIGVSGMNPEQLQSMTPEAIAADLTQREQQFYSNFNSYIQAITHQDKYKDQPVCVLIHPDMTEGIDCKHNPAILLMEPPNTYGDYDQLCGRVLRTYSLPGYKQAPEKMVYQFVAYNRKNLQEIASQRLRADDIDQYQGKNWAYDEKKNITANIWIAQQQEVEMLEKYRPSSILEYPLAVIATEGEEASWWKRPKFYLQSWGKWINTWVGDEIESAKAAQWLSQYTKIWRGREGISFFQLLTRPFYGDLDLNIAIVNRDVELRVQAVEKLNEKIDAVDRSKRANNLRYTLGAGTFLESIRGSTQNSVNADREVLSKIIGSISVELMTNMSPDFIFCEKIRQMDVQVQDLKKKLMQKTFPDLTQIYAAKNTVKATVPSIARVPWCDPFIEPTLENRALMCRPIQNIESMVLKTTDTAARNAFVEKVKQTNYNEVAIRPGKPGNPGVVKELDDLYKTYKDARDTIGIRYKGEAEDILSRQAAATSTPATAVNTNVEVTVNVPLTRARGTVAAFATDPISRALQNISRLRTTLTLREKQESEGYTGAAAGAEKAKTELEAAMREYNRLLAERNAGWYANQNARAQNTRTAKRRVVESRGNGTGNARARPGFALGMATAKNKNKKKTFALRVGAPAPAASAASAAPLTWPKGMKWGAKPAVSNSVPSSAAVPPVPASAAPPNAAPPNAKAANANAKAANAPANGATAEKLEGPVKKELEMVGGRKKYKYTMRNGRRSNSKKTRNHRK